MKFERMMIMDMLDEFVGGPLLFAVLGFETEGAKWMPIESTFVPFNHGLMAVDLHRFMIMQYRKS